jgi:hypothetical protein
VQSRPGFSYAAANLTPMYRAVGRPQNDNPSAANVVREFLFIRPMETLVILDRLESNSVGTVMAANIPKAFLAHFENAPQITTPGTVLAVNGNQALRLITLVPANPTYRVVDESTGGGTALIAQYRLEVETSGQAQSYFLHVLQARDASAGNITATVAEDSSTFRVALSHPTAGTASVVFNKGMTSFGGSVQLGSAPAEGLLGRVQSIVVGDAGPIWEGGPGAPPPPASPSGIRIIP